VLARSADGDVSDAHGRSQAMFGQVTRIRHSRGECGRVLEEGQPRNGKDVSEGTTGITFGPL
jgi:hypothetical protein